MWLDRDEAFNLRSAAGDTCPAEAVGLNDILSLAHVAPGADITLLGAEGRTVRDGGGRPGHEVVIEIDVAGETRRWRFGDPGGNAMLGARGMVLAIEKLAGLSAGKPPGGLYLPEQLIDPDEAIHRLFGWGIEVEREID